MTIQGPRAARGMEIRSAAELAHRVFRTGGDAHLPCPADDEVRENLRVFADDGKVVSLVAMTYREIVLLGVRHLACCFGGVCTDPDYRGRGLATRLLGDCREKALAGGADLVLISGRRGLYKRPGYVETGAFNVCTIRRDRMPVAGRHQYELRPARREDMRAVLELSVAEPARFVRTPDEFLHLLQRNRLCTAPGESRLVWPKGGDRPVAFVACQIGGAPWEHKAENAITVLEMGGSRRAIMQAMAALLAERGLDDMTLRYADRDVEVSQMAAGFGWPSEPTGFRGTVGIIDPGRFWQACAPLFREKLGGEAFGRVRFSVDGDVRIRYGDEELVLADMSLFTDMVFCHPRHRDRLELGLAEGSDLRQMLDRLFPLPLVNYGLNYY